MWFYSRSSASTISNLNSGVGHIRKFESKFQVKLTPTPLRKEDFSVIANAWYMMDRGSKVKVQSLQSDLAAFSYLFAAAAVDNPHVSHERGRLTMCGRARLGLAHVLGTHTTKSPRLTAALVLAFQTLCISRARAAKSIPDKLYYLELGFYVVASFMGFLRPNELCNGQGRWRRNAQEPCLMVRRYIQSTLRAKLSTSDYGVNWQDWDCQ
jgi:hypothetical protein